MVFGKSTKPAEPKGHDSELHNSPPEAAENVVSADRALDFMAEMLRILGEQAFDVGSRSALQIEEFFETWARHLLVGVPPPHRIAPTESDADQEGEGAETSCAKRDLPGLRRSLRDHREAEVEYVTHSLESFRTASWAFMSSLRRSLTVEQASDRRIGHRMRRLEGAVRSGDADKIKSEAQETVSQLTEYLAERGTRHESQVQEMAARLEGLRDELDNVRKQAAIDPVTQIFNRSAFDEQIEREIDLATIFGKRGCLIMVDLDHFKWVNDNHGHPCGDAVLREVAQTLNRCFMRRDDFVARYGGEEFVIVLRDITTPVAADVIERGMNAIRNLEIPWTGLDEPIRVTASMGLARLRQGETAAAWVERADRALYQAKEAGRDRVAVDPIDLDEA